MALNAGVQPLLADSLPTNYEYYTSGGINSGLSADQTYFTLNDRNISIYSGSMHYFRVPRAYWRDRLRKMRAAGLNAVETYIPWNLHEYESGKYDFGNGGSEMEDFLNVTEYLKIAQEEDLFAIIRSGPFICGEFEFGGFPSWLLRDEMTVRTSDSTYMKYVSQFFNVLMPILAMLQFTKGGPIIALQVENEYALMGKNDETYLKGLRQLMLDNGIVELLATSDNPVRGTIGSIPDLFLMTGNFDENPSEQLDMLKALQPSKPLMTMEFWSGWYDYWGQDHTTKGSDVYRSVYEGILSYPSSVNIYMFHGGTSFRFLNGALNSNYDVENSGYEPMTSSYDYGSPLSETGDYTEKYYITQELLAKYNPIKTQLPEAPELASRIAYPTLTVQGQIPIIKLLDTLPSMTNEYLTSMEWLDVNDNSGQSYGYVIYRKENLNIPADAKLVIEGRICDTVMVLVNGVLISPFLEYSDDLDRFGTWRWENSYITLSSEDLQGATLDLIVENWGRVNVGTYKQYKGLYQGSATLNDEVLTDWTIYPLEFKKSWTNSVNSWESVDLDSWGPALYRAVLDIQDEPQDTFVYMEDWKKGIVIVNGFVLGRYAHMGPIQTLYLPAPFLKKGSNDIVVFDHFKPSAEISFSTEHVYASH